MCCVRQERRTAWVEGRLLLLWLKERCLLLLPLGLEETSLLLISKRGWLVLRLVSEAINIALCVKAVGCWLENRVRVRIWLECIRLKGVESVWLTNILITELRRFILWELIWWLPAIGTPTWSGILGLEAVGLIRWFELPASLLLLLRLLLLSVWWVEVVAAVSIIGWERIWRWASRLLLEWIRLIHRVPLHTIWIVAGKGRNLPAWSLLIRARVAAYTVRRLRGQFFFILLFSCESRFLELLYCTRGHKWIRSGATLIQILLHA